MQRTTFNFQLIESMEKVKLNWKSDVDIEGSFYNDAGALNRRVEIEIDTNER